MVTELHLTIEWFAKSVWYLNKNKHDYFHQLNTILNNDNSIINNFDIFNKNQTFENIKYFKSIFINENLEKLLTETKQFDHNTSFRKEFQDRYTTKEKLSEIDEILSYDHNQIVRRLAANDKPIYPNLRPLEPFTKHFKTINFDKLHRDSINSLEICPNSKLLASASSDGTINFIDLETVTHFPQITITDPEKSGIKS